MSPRDRRVLIGGAAIVAAGWLGLRGGPTLWAAWRGAEERLVAERILLAETRSALAALPVLEDSARVLTTRVAKLAPRILSGSTAPLALSAWSARLTSLVGLCHGRVTRFEPLPGSVRAGPLEKVTATVGVETDFRGLAELLERLGQDPVVTVVERLQVTPTDPLSAVGMPERLNVELRLSAWYLAREAGS